jgi:paraquat-inducible protein B
MSKPVNPSLIGGFVVGAIALLVIGFSVFGGGDYFTQKSRLVTFFDGSVQGLRVGSNVVFRGVRVGFVEKVELLTDPESLEPMIKVSMQLDPSSVRILRVNELSDKELEKLMDIDRLIERGLSAQMASESFLTGQLLINLDFRPDRDLKITGIETDYPEIPSVPSDVQLFIERTQAWMIDIQENIRLDELVVDIQSVLKGVETLVNSPDLSQSLTGMNRLLNSDETQQLSASMNQTLKQLQAVTKQAENTLNQTSATLNGIDSNVNQLSSAFQLSLTELNKTLTDTQSTLRSAKKQLDGDSEQMYQLQSTLTQIESTARSARMLFDYLERHPEALLRGKTQ